MAYSIPIGTMPSLVREFASYKSVIQNASEKTVSEYLLDLRTFFRFYIKVWCDIFYVWIIAKIWKVFRKWYKIFEINNVKIGFNQNHYVNLYDMSETFLQIIRPNHEDLTTEELTKSQMTILAPHLPNESEFDDPLKLFYEFMYMTEQRIGVEK